MNLPTRKYPHLLGVCSLICSAALFANSEEPLEVFGFRIAHFVNASSEANIVVVSAGKKDGIVDGALFTAYRQRHVTPQEGINGAGIEDKIWVETGTLKALAVKDKLTVAQIMHQDFPMAKVFFPKFAGVMAGDVVRENKIAITAVQIATPSANMIYMDIFADPKASPTSFELTEEGKEKIREAAKVFANARLPMLMVEGHTDGNGLASANQTESQERAMAVRQFLITELKFDSKKVVAMGFGESEPVVEGFAPGYKEQNRRIVLKAVSHEDEPQAPSDEL